MESTAKATVRIMVIALVGVGTSLAAVVNFVLAVSYNRIPWHAEAREFYVAVGRSYTEGFAIGFFLCFSLAVAATAVAGTLEQRRPALDADRYGTSGARLERNRDGGQT